MALIGINTAAIVQGGITFMAKNAPNAAKKETFGLGKCNVGYDKLFKAFLITEALGRENSYTQEQIQCLESELLNEIQSQENLQPIIPAPPLTAAALAGPVEISTEPGAG